MSNVVSRSSNNSLQDRSNLPIIARKTSEQAAYLNLLNAVLGRSAHGQSDSKSLPRTFGGSTSLPS